MCKHCYIKEKGELVKFDALNNFHEVTSLFTDKSEMTFRILAGSPGCIFIRPCWNCQGKMRNRFGKTLRHKFKFLSVLWFLLR